MLGIKNYEPNFFSDTTELIKQHAQHLRILIGTKLEGIWTVHEATDGEIWADCPVILGIGGKQVELCSFKDGFSITWNKIDIKKKLNWYGSEELHLVWEKNRVEDLSINLGKQIKEIEIIETSPGSLHGIGFQMGSSYFSVFNGFDETQFSYERDKDLLYTKL
ncbi:hypothetical protein V7138_10855 [Bacillus sp. JJ1533]|uniref:hypothetical protein n=1 Tax=Bacillus sp. JJ1533 TaxID=3122959 RepID=UPI002FFFB60E